MSLSGVKAVGLIALILSCSIYLVGCADTTESLGVLVERTRVLEQQGKLREALEVNARAIEIRPNDAVLHYDRGVLHGQLDEFELSIKAYTRSIELDGSRARTFNNRAVAHAQLREFQSAINDCDQALKLEPNDPMTYRNRGLAYHDLGEFDKALADYDASIRLDGRSVMAFFNRGNVYLETKKYERAIEDYNQALDIDSAHALSYQNRGVALATLGQRDAAAADFAAANRIDSKLRPVWPAEGELVKPNGAIRLASVRSTATTNQSQNLMERAIQMASDHLKSDGFLVVPEGDKSLPWQLKCAKSDTEFVAIIRLADENSERSVNFTAAEIALIRGASPKTRLVMVSGLSSSGEANSMGTVWVSKDDWFDESRLTPTAFRFSAGSDQPSAK